MKVLFVVPSLMQGGAERVISILCNQFNRRGYKVLLALTENAKDICYELDEEVIICDASSSKSRIISNLIEANRKLDSIVKSIRPDIIVSFITRTNISAILAAKKYKVPVVVSERNNPYEVPANLLFRKIRDLVYLWADGVVFQTDYAKSYYNKIIQRRSTVIINPVSDKVAEYRGKRRIEDIIISVGRLEPQKNMTLLIKAFSDIANTIPEWKLHIYGEGEERNKLEQLISDLGMKDRILLLGLSNNVLQEVAKAKIFVLSSDFEGMSNALLEAVCLGVPSIATDSPAYGNREIIKDGINGFIVPVGDRVALAQKIIELIHNERVRVSFAEKSDSIYHLANPSSIADKWTEYINKILQKDGEIV